MNCQEKERMEALRKMLSEQDREVVSLESLKHMMEEELSKEEQDIDPDYVDELAQMILEYQCSQPADTAPSARRKQKHCACRRMARTASLILLLGTVLTLSTANIAGAFSWVDLVKFLSPLMEQLGINVNVDSDEEMNQILKPETTQDAEESEENWGEIFDYVIHQESDLPESIQGYPVKPPYLPEGYAFKRADMFSDGSLTNLCITYSAGERELYIMIRIYSQKLGGDIFLAEQKAEEQPLNRIDILDDQGIVTAVMNLNTCHYSAWGKESQETIYQIIQEYEEEIFP